MISSKITFSFDENGFDFYRLFIFTLLKKKTNLISDIFKNQESGSDYKFYPSLSVFIKTRHAFNNVGYFYFPKMAFKV